MTDGVRRLDDGRNDDAAVRYERSDASLAGVLGFYVLLIASGVILVLILLALLPALAPGDTLPKARALQPEVARPGEPPPRAAFTALAPKPGVEPLVQAFPEEELRQFRAHEDEVLNAWRWDRDTGAIHIPIDEAMALLVAQPPAGPPSAPTAAERPLAPAPTDAGGWRPAPRSSDAP